MGDNALVVRAMGGMQEMGRKEMNGPDEPARTTPVPVGMPRKKVNCNQEWLGKREERTS